MAAADCSLLFGILALQNGLIDQADLIAAFQAWSKDRSRPLSQVLLDRGALNESDRALLDGLVRRHLQKHGDSPERSLADVPVAAAVREGLRQLADPDLDASLARLDIAARRSPDRRRPRLRGDHDLGCWNRLGLVPPAGSRSSGRTPGEASAPSRWPWTRNSTARWPSRRSRPSGPTTRRAATGSCSRPRSPGRLEHPGIVPVYSLGCDDFGRPFYAMRFVRGDTFKEAIDRFHATESPQGGARTRGSERSSSAGCSGGSSTSATRSPTPTAAG